MRTYPASLCARRTRSCRDADLSRTNQLQMPLITKPVSQDGCIKENEESQSIETRAYIRRRTNKTNDCSNPAHRQCLHPWSGKLLSSRSPNHALDNDSKPDVVICTSMRLQRLRFDNTQQRVVNRFFCVLAAHRLQFGSVCPRLANRAKDLSKTLQRLCSANANLPRRGLI